MGNPGKANLIQKLYFTRFVPLELGSAQLVLNRPSYCHQNQAKPCFRSHKACTCGRYRNTSPKRTFAQKYALEGWFLGSFGPLEVDIAARSCLRGGLCAP